MAVIADKYKNNTATRINTVKWSKIIVSQIIGTCISYTLLLYSTEICNEILFSVTVVPYVHLRNKIFIKYLKKSLVYLSRSIYRNDQLDDLYTAPILRQYHTLCCCLLLGIKLYKLILKYTFIGCRNLENEKSFKE